MYEKCNTQRAREREENGGERHHNNRVLIISESQTGQSCCPFACICMCVFVHCMKQFAFAQTHEMPRHFFYHFTERMMQIETNEKKKICSSNFIVVCCCCRCFHLSLFNSLLFVGGAAVAVAVVRTLVCVR